MTDGETAGRSFWAWGRSERFPNDTARKQIAQMVGAFLGGVAVTPRPLPSLDDVVIPEPRVEAPAELAGFVTRDRVQRVLHTYGRGYTDIVRGFRGDFGSAPDLVAHPTSEDDIAAVLRWAGAAGVAVIPYGGGTSVVGGVEAAVGAGWAGALSLDMRGLDQVLEIDETSLLARIQAGATGPGLEGQLAERGLTLRHFPQSFEFSTLGGWLATRAGGHFATVYTHIDDLCASMRAVTPTGVYESRRLPGSGAGPSPDRLMLGSEGALAVITEAWMRVRPRPNRRAKATVRFAELDDAVAATRVIAQSGLYPTNCRVLDKREALLNRLRAAGKHLLILGFESVDRDVLPALEQALGLALAHGGECPDGVQEKPESAEAWRSAFIDAPYLQSALVSMGVLADTFETAIPWDRFPALHADLVREVRGALEEQCGKGLLSCRFTHVYPDGPAPYYTFIGPAREGEELEQWAAIKTVASEVLMRHGATITHHHAVGRTHMPWYQRQRPEVFGRVLEAAKRELDPAGVLNPGVLVSELGYGGSE